MNKLKGKSVFLSDRLVLIGIGLGIVYWVIETFLYVFLSYSTGFFTRLLGPDLNGICTRVIVLCLFLIFGSHAQYTCRNMKQVEDELERLKNLNSELKDEISGLKTGNIDHGG